MYANRNVDNRAVSELPASGNKQLGSKDRIINYYNLWFVFYTLMDAFMHYNYLINEMRHTNAPKMKYADILLSV